MNCFSEIWKNEQNLLTLTAREKSITRLFRPSNFKIKHILTIKPQPMAVIKGQRSAAQFRKLHWAAECILVVSCPCLVSLSWLAREAVNLKVTGSIPVEVRNRDPEGRGVERGEGAEPSPPRENDGKILSDAGGGGSRGGRGRSPLPPRKMMEKYWATRRGGGSRGGRGRSPRENDGKVLSKLWRKSLRQRAGTAHW